uniref:Uncharacterized protein n=1 Tax=Parascaris univalens TaxID=6257 RepID=A0A915BM21_PARUN
LSLTVIGEFGSVPIIPSIEKYNRVLSRLQYHNPRRILFPSEGSIFKHKGIFLQGLGGVSAIWAHGDNCVSTFSFQPHKG